MSLARLTGEYNPVLTLRTMQEYDYVLKTRAGQRHIRMQFSDSGRLIVSAPPGVSKQKIEAFISANGAWIEKTAATFKSHTYENGDTVPYLGRTCLLLVSKGPENNVRYLDGNLLVTTKRQTGPEGIKKHLRAFYAKTILEQAAPLVTKWCRELKIKEPKLETANSKTRWAVCIPAKNTVRFSIITATLEPDLIEMITVHELCHMFHCNHGTQFHRLLESLVPDIKDKENRLRAVSKAGISKNLF